MQRWSIRVNHQWYQNFVLGWSRLWSGGTLHEGRTRKPTGYPFWSHCRPAWYSCCWSVAYGQSLVARLGKCRIFAGQTHHHFLLSSTWTPSFCTGCTAVCSLFRMSVHLSPWLGRPWSRQWEDTSSDLGPSSWSRVFSTFLFSRWPMLSSFRGLEPPAHRASSWRADFSCLLSWSRKAYLAERACLWGLWGSTSRVLPQAKGSSDKGFFSLGNTFSILLRWPSCRHSNFSWIYCSSL